MLTLYNKRSDKENEYPLRNFFNEFTDRHWRADTKVEIKIKKEIYEDKLLEIRFSFECNKEEGGDSYQESEDEEDHMSRSIYYWVTMELEKSSQFKDLVKQCNKLNGKDGKKKRTKRDIMDKIDKLFYDIFKVYDQMITIIKTF